MPKIKLEGWIKSGSRKKKVSNVPKKCPKCGSKLWRTDALKTAGVYWVGCSNPICRWQDVYMEDG